MTRSLKTEAIVLKKRSLLTKDQIITLFTLESGKLTVFAKGIKKISSKRLPHLQTANLINTLIYQKDDRFYLQETSLISAFSQIKKAPQKMKMAYLLLYIIDRIAPENQKEKEIYSLVKKFLIELGQTLEFSDSKFEQYLYKLLKLLGYVRAKNSLKENLELIEELTGEKLPSFII